MKVWFKNYKNRVKLLFSASLKKKHICIALCGFLLYGGFLYWSRDCFFHNYFGKNIIKKGGFVDIQLVSSCPLMKVTEIRAIAADFGAELRYSRCPERLKFKKIEDISRNYSSFKKDDPCYISMGSIAAALVNVRNNGSKYDYDIELYEKDGDLIVGILSRGYIPFFTFDDFRYVYKEGRILDFPFISSEIAKCKSKNSKCEINYKGEFKENLPKNPHDD